MADFRILFLSIPGFIIGIVLFIKGLGWMRFKRLIENTPTSKVNAIAMGLVEVYGEAVPAGKKILKSPFTNKDCVYYRYTIEEYRKSGKNSRWVTVKRDEQRVPFFLKDESGSVLVDPQNSKIETKQSYSTECFGEPPAIIKKFLTENEMGIGTSLFGREIVIGHKRRYTEYLIAPGDKLYIMGTAADNPHLEEGTAKKSAEDIMIQEAKGEPFFISDKPEKDIIKLYNWITIGGVYGGAAVSTGCLIVILLYFRIF